MNKRSAQSKSLRSARATASAAAPVAAAAPKLAPATDRWPWALLALCVVFNAVALWPEWTARVAARNDTAFHLLMIEGASDALAGGANPLDFWIPQLELGFPQFLYYQHLPHLVLAGLHRVGAGMVTAAGLLHGAQYLLLVAMPCTVAWSMYRLGFSAAASAFGGFASTLLSAESRMALEYNSYVWRGYGLFSQLCGVHLFLLLRPACHAPCAPGPATLDRPPGWRRWCSATCCSGPSWRSRASCSGWPAPNAGPRCRA